MLTRLFPVALLGLAAPVQGQSIDRILVAAAERDAARNCGPAGQDELIVCGDRDAVHRAGQSIVGWTVGEDMAGSLENHLVERVV